MTLHSRTTIHLLVALSFFASATVTAQELGYIGVELQDLTAEQARARLAGQRGARLVAESRGAGRASRAEDRRRHHHYRRTRCRAGAIS